MTWLLSAGAVVGLMGSSAVEGEGAPGGRSNQISGRINPNEATWWELSHLSGIGEVRARAIVEHRERVRARRGSESSVVFRRPADLTKVRSISADVVAQAGPGLTFPGD